jgi:uncharacterized protein YciI
MRRRWVGWCSAGAFAAAAAAASGQATPGAEPPAVEPRLYAVEIRVGPKWDAAKPAGEQAYFREHSANLRKLREGGQLVLGARYGDKGLVVVSAPSAEAARALIDADPSIAHGTFSYELHEFRVFYPGAVPARSAR